MSDLLAPLVAGKRARRFLVLDLESKDGDTQKGGFTRVFLAGFFDGSSYLDWYGDDCLRRLMRHLLTPTYSGCYIYAHYGGSFDYFHLLPLLTELPDSFEVEIVPVASAIQAMRIKRGRYTWTFLDSYKLIPASLEKAGKALKVAMQKEVDFDYDTPETDPRWLKYLEQDCRSLYEIVSKFHRIIEDELGGEVGVTLASTSMLTYRRRYLKAPIQRAKHAPDCSCQPGANGCVHDFVRRGYYGGNTQMFVRKAEGLHCYDINSSYPFAMLDRVPVAYERGYCGKPPAQFLDHSIGFVEARIDWSGCDYPCLPFRAPQGKLIYPIGTFSGVWMHEELLLAEDMGASVEWGPGHWFHGAAVLADYMRALYAYRDQSSPKYDEVVSYVAKLLANSCYGKFGQNTQREKIILRSEEADFPLDARAANDDDDCRVFYQSEESDADYIIPQIAATITAKARINLQRFINLAHAAGGIIAYCDTDSILTTADLSEHCGTALGQLKDEGAGCTFTGHFIQPKLYKLVNEQTSEVKVRMKGFRKADEDVFERARSGETIVRQELEKLGALAHAGFKRGPLMREVKKSIRSIDTKRTWNEDGTSSPLVLLAEDLFT